MAFPRTEGNAFSTNHQRFGWDLQYLVQALQDEGADVGSRLYQGVATATALMGHSMGGGASFLAADSLCQQNSPLLKALVGLAPAESSSNGVSSINSARRVTVPSLILSGSRDGVTPPNVHHIPMYDSLASTCKTFVSITGGAHCYFANSNFNCDFGELTASSGISVSRAEQQAMMLDYLLPFLDYWLKYDCSASSILMDSLLNSNRTTYEQACTPSLLIDTAITVMGNVLTANAPNAHYRWIDCATGLPIVGATNQSYQAANGGTVAVEVQHYHCVERSSCRAIAFTNTSKLPESLLASLTPNPSSVVVRLNLVAGSPYSVAVYNRMGQLVYEQRQVQRSVLELDVSAWPVGAYAVRVQRADAAQTLRLVKR